MGVIVVICSEKKPFPSGPIPSTLRDSWKAGRSGSHLRTHQDHTTDAVPDSNDLPEWILRGEEGPPYSTAVRMEWGLFTCPPLALDGVVVHGSIKVTAMIIRPPLFALLRSLGQGQGKKKWAMEQLPTVVRVQSPSRAFLP